MIPINQTPRTAARHQLVDNLGDRIDPYEIAARVVNAVEEEWGTVGEDMCIELWSIALDELYTRFQKLARRLADPPYEN